MLTELSLSVSQVHSNDWKYQAFKRRAKKEAEEYAWCFIASRFLDALGVEMWRIDCKVLGAKMDATKKADEVDADWVADVVAEMRKTIVVLSENLQNRGDRLE